MLGYILAGLAIGPHTPGFVADVPTVEELADLGIVFLMFAIGVQLSLTDLLKAGRLAVVGGNLQVLLTIGAGYLLGIWLGWGQLESLFFGAVVSNSSSTVLSKVLSERGEEDSFPGRIAIAWSTVQDFGTVVLVVVLTTLAQGEREALPLELAEAVGLVALFLFAVVPAGLWLLPRFFERVSATGSSEVFVLSAAVVALGVALLASLFGISFALGAFVAGILVGRSDISHEILGRITSLRDLFAGLFFVSVGMLIDPRLVVDNLHLVLAAAALIVVFKGALVAGITMAFRYRPKTALITGVILGQSAEFSFLIARLGTDLNVLSADVFGVILTGAALSIVVAPYVLSAAHPLGGWLERRLPLGGQSDFPEGAERWQIREHAVLCGYGRVGRVIHRALRAQGIECVVIEQDPRTVGQLRASGVPALQGSASNPVVLERAGISRARVLLVAIPEPLSVRQIVDVARRVNPSLDIVVRTHSRPERVAIEARGANEAVLGELELALEMSRHALLRFGVSAEGTEDLLQRTRHSVDGEG